MNYQHIAFQLKVLYVIFMTVRMYKKFLNMSADIQETILVHIHFSQKNTATANYSLSECLLLFWSVTPPTFVLPNSILTTWVASWWRKQRIASMETSK